MEFYRKKGYHASSRKIDFNSQRDGILPNNAADFAPLVRDFNSQRDGILLTIGMQINFEVMILIPNGMEFYAIVDFRGLIGIAPF